MADGRPISPLWAKVRRYSPVAARTLWYLLRVQDLFRGRRSVRVSAAEVEQARVLREKVDHVVVLMLENRSFDNMLGYLSLDGAVRRAELGLDPVDGLKPGLSNDVDGHPVPVAPQPHTHLTKEEDPGHSERAVREQVGDGRMDGFAQNFADTRRGDASVVMGYHTADQLPIYDHLATEFAVCDRWFSSVPGATMPNRLYAASGSAEGSLDNWELPLYNRPSVMRQLDRRRWKVPWRWYSFDPSSLRMMDGRYRLFHDGQFAAFERRSPLDKKNFFDDLRGEQGFPQVAWIDPNFVDFNPFYGPPDSNDDHPPSDVLAGQELVWRVYDGLTSVPEVWERTLFLIVYDEHGGFYDHVGPPGERHGVWPEYVVPDEDPKFRRLGVRVPALVISPYARRGAVVNDVFDHASIIKTLLLRFCLDGDRIPDMGARVTAAAALASTLELDAPRDPVPIPDHRKVVEALAEWRGQAYLRWVSGDTPTEAVRAVKETDPVPGEPPFSAGVLNASEQLRVHGGQPPGQN